MLNWFLIYTKPKCEDRVALRLIENSFDVLNPKIKERKLVRRRLQDAISPLFPCYVFARFDNPRDYRLIKYTRGVRTIVGVDSIPAIVPEEIVAEIRRRTWGGFLTISPQGFNPGEEVLIRTGPFEGLGAIFERELKGAERVSILLKAVSARVVVNSAILERA